MSFLSDSEVQLCNCPLFQTLNDGLVDLDLSWNCVRLKGAVAITNALKVSNETLLQPSRAKSCQSWNNFLTLLYQEIRKASNETILQPFYAKNSQSEKVQYYHDEISQ